MSLEIILLEDNTINFTRSRLYFLIPFNQLVLNHFESLAQTSQYLVSIVIIQPLIVNEDFHVGIWRQTASHDAQMDYRDVFRWRSSCLWVHMSLFKSTLWALPCPLAWILCVGELRRLIFRYIRRELILVLSDLVNRRIIDVVAALADFGHHIHLADLVVFQGLLPLESETR